jgi:hypothetical protein
VVATVFLQVTLFAPLVDLGRHFRPVCDELVVLGLEPVERLLGEPGDVRRVRVVSHRHVLLLADQRPR